ncbi:MAG: D-alanyl-D-alanine carboxypeptidase/D-alanyl-D-alanine endopeptidase [Planctomycetota bacterium]|jgi:D-alanyl-D-alanine carboxypeptidase/D-alanyl-D-alanine-endopeptidase (penicillin-binding protein 4)
MNRFKCGILAAAGAIHLLACTTVADLRDDVTILVDAAAIPNATIAVSVRDAAGDGALISINAEQRMIPASNMKLLVTGAALHALGADFEFKTRLIRDGDRLVIVGDGDPAFGDPALLEKIPLDIEEFLATWVDEVVESGLEAVTTVLVDDRVFDRRFVQPSWPADQLNRWYCAQAAGLNFHLNVLHFYPQPRPDMRPDITIFQPHADWLRLTNRATSRTEQHENNTAWIARRLGTNDLTVFGNVKFAYRMPVRVTVHDMPSFFARLLADRLTEAGIEVGGFGVVAGDDPSVTGEVLAEVVTPISTAVTRSNRDSQNLYAECLIKRIGAALTRQPGSWMNGGAIVRHVLHERLHDPVLASLAAVADGSGMSRDNRIAPATMTAWLNSFHHDSQLGPILINSLAVPGKGTLKRRFHGVELHEAKVRAKSGYIRGVSCLSGYVTMPDGRRRSFSIMVNGFSGAALPAMQLQEQIVAAIAADMAEAAVVLGGE